MPYQSAKMGFTKPYSLPPDVGWRSGRLFFILDTQFNSFLNYPTTQRFTLMYNTIYTILAVGGKYLPVDLSKEIKTQLEQARLYCNAADNPNIPGKAYSQATWYGIESWRNRQRDSAKQTVYALISKLNIVASDAGLRGGETSY